MRWPCTTLFICAAILVSSGNRVGAQARQDPVQPVQPVQPSVPPPANPAAESSSSRKTSEGRSHAHDFLIRGTVFTPQGLSFPGVRVRVRKVEKKKFKWNTYTNSRGEFAVRVPQGAEYEIVVHEKKFVEMTRKIDARTGRIIDDLVFRMEPEAGGKQ